MTTFIVTVKLRSPEETIERKWASAVDSADAIHLTLTHLDEQQRQRVERVLAREAA